MLEAMESAESKPIFTTFSRCMKDLLYGPLEGEIRQYPGNICYDAHVVTTALDIREEEHLRSWEPAAFSARSLFKTSFSLCRDCTKDFYDFIDNKGG